MLRTGLQAQLFFSKRGKRNQRVTQFFPSRDNINKRTEIPAFQLELTEIKRVGLFYQGEVK